MYEKEITMPEISIIMLVHNQLAMTRQAIRALRRWSADYELIIFDNGSDQETAQYLVQMQKAYPYNTKLIRSDKNIGFIKGNNEAAKVATCDFICCLNNDVLIRGTWVHKLLHVLKKDPSVAQVGARKMATGPELCYLEGWCFVIPRWAYEKFGLFDEVNLEFAYCEDTDLSYRLLEAGYKIEEVKLPMLHAQSITRNSIHDVDFTSIHRRNTAYLEKRWGQKLTTNPESLTTLATLYKSDKWGMHWYAQHYDKHFQRFRDKKFNLLEIGVGGYENTAAGGESLRMWKSYFPHARLYGIDLYNKKAVEEDRIKTFQGSQDDEAFLKDTFKQVGSLDIIIDDGSHVNDHILKSFKTLFPLLNADGIYAIEDVQTSYWAEYGGSEYTDGQADTVMNYFKRQVDGLNHVEYKSPYGATYFDKNIFSIHFYHNLIIIHKWKNDEACILP